MARTIQPPADAAACQRIETACDEDFTELQGILSQQAALDPRDMTRTLAAHAGMLQIAYRTIRALQERVAALEWKLTQ